MHACIVTRPWHVGLLLPCALCAVCRAQPNVLVLLLPPHPLPPHPPPGCLLLLVMRPAGPLASLWRSSCCSCWAAASPVGLRNADCAAIMRGTGFTGVSRRAEVPDVPHAARGGDPEPYTPRRPLVRVVLSCAGVRVRRLVRSPAGAGGAGGAGRRGSGSCRPPLMPVCAAR